MRRPWRPRPRASRGNLRNPPLPRRSRAVRSREQSRGGVCREHRMSLVYASGKPTTQRPSATIALFHLRPFGLPGYGLRDHEPARPPPTASYPVPVHQVKGFLHASFRPRLATTPLRVVILHLQAVEHAWHTQKEWAPGIAPILRSLPRANHRRSLASAQ